MIRFFLFIISCLLASANLLPAQPPAAQRQAFVLLRQLQRLHYSSRPVDDSLSVAVFNAFIKELDDERVIFTTADYTTLAAYQYKIDEELMGNGWAFLDAAGTLYKQRLLRADSITKAVLKKPFDFKPDEKLIIPRGVNKPFAASEKELADKWTKHFKYILLSQAYSIATADSTKPSLISVIAKKETELREKLKKSTAKGFTETLNAETFTDEIKQTFFNAIASVFDPHSNFFSPKEKEDFQAEVSTEEYSFGFETDETKEGAIIISQLIPGGPAWKTGELHKNDELLQLQWKDKPVINISETDADEVEEELAKSNHDELTITIKKTNGLVRTVTLRKEKIETEDDVVKGYLLDGDKKVGYISLPDFYTTWEDEQGSGCANDMAKEIIKMKKEHLDGLILDLRYNGGGSLNEALQLCGIFIDEGPLTGIREKEGKVSFAKDPNRGTIYDGPLIVMINNQSASASELVAAALQDYNRALIAGSPTFGKATMQIVYPMDSTAKPGAKSDEGYVKITTGKLYRISGQTAQLNGVQPDVVIPDAYDGMEYTEKFMPHAMPADTVKRNSYYKPLPPMPLASLVEASKKRISSNASFQELQKSINRRKAAIAAGKTEIPVSAAAFENWIKEREALIKSMDEKEDVVNPFFKTVNYTMEQQRLQNNAYAAEMNAAALKSIEKDKYIQEAFLIMKDFITALKK